MIDGGKVLGVILARGGSKRVPGKNLREYRGQSLLQWAIDAGKGSRYVDDLWVSSDDDRILASANCARLKRPGYLSSDEATSEGALIHAIYCVGRGYVPHEWVVLLQPTSPLRTAEDVDCCIEIARNGDGCLSCCADDHTPNGAVYVARIESFLASLKLDRGLRYAMPAERCLDIDYEEQLLAEC